MASNSSRFTQCSKRLATRPPLLATLYRVTRGFSYPQARPLDKHATLRLAGASPQGRSARRYGAIGCAMLLAVALTPASYPKAEATPLLIHKTISLRSTQKPINTLALLHAYAYSLIGNKSHTQCLIVLWTRESHWNYKATNGNHYGIPQSWERKVAYMDAYAQVRFGVRYIERRYGNACLALAHSNRENWY